MGPYQCRVLRFLYRISPEAHAKVPCSHHHRLGHDHWRRSDAADLPPWHIQGVQFSGKLWLLLACVIVLGTVLSFSLFQSGCSIVGSLVGSVLSSIEPVGSVVISVLFLHTAFTWLDLLGFSLILVTIPLMAIGKAREQ